MNWLHELGEGAFTEFDAYVVKHDLYKLGLKIYEYNKERSNDIMYLFAEHLQKTINFSEAGLAFEYLGKLDQALENYILAKKWKSALSIVEKSEFNKSLKTRLIAL